MRPLALFLVAAMMALATSTSGESAKAPSPFEVRKVEQKLRAELPCLGCHTLAGEGGRLGPDLSTVRERRSPAYIAAMIADPDRVVPGTMMPRTVMTEQARELLVRYLATRPGSAPDGPRPPLAGATTSPSVADGAALYARWCSACHGATGRGDGRNSAFLPVPPAHHADAQTMRTRPDSSLYDTIAAGGAAMNRSPRMPSFGATLTPTEIGALVAHVRKLCSCEGPTWSRHGDGP